MYHTILKSHGLKIERGLNMNNSSCSHVKPVKVTRLHVKTISGLSDYEKCKCENVDAHLLNKSDIHKEYCDKLNKIYVAKNHDYGDCISKCIDTYGYVSMLVRMDDKLHRLNTLIAKKENAEVSESIEDTLLDLANYALITLTELTDRKNVQ